MKKPYHLFGGVFSFMYICLVELKIKAMNYTIQNVHISTITAGDTILSKDGFMRTITKSNLGGDSFIGRTINGDSYKSGNELVKKVVFNLAVTK